jgi:polyisoprenoid-binding protein YceI
MVRPILSRATICRMRKTAIVFALALACAGARTAAQDLTLQFDPQHTTINFTLGDVLHTVRGSFGLRRGSVNVDLSSGKTSGEIVIDGRSGATGNGMRDRKMHREVLESDRYPEIAFRPDRVDGSVSPQGKSSVSVHGIFSIHGADHEMTVPAQVETFPDHWSATLHFTVPYVKWGLKNPSTLFLRVNDSVDVDVNAAGTVTRP